MKPRMLAPVAAILCVAACGDSGAAFPGPQAMVVVMTATATRAQADAVIARCGGLPGADGGEIFMDDRQPGELRLRLEDDVTAEEQLKIRECLASSPGVDVQDSEGFPVPG